MKLFLLRVFTFLMVGACLFGVSNVAVAAGGGAPAEGGGVEFVQLAPLTLPIVDSTGVTQTVNLVVALEVPDAAAAAKVEKYKPRLTDAYIQELYGVLNEHAALKGGVIQIGFIKEKLKKISDKVLGEGIVDNVLLQVVQQQSL